MIMRSRPLKFATIVTAFLMLACSSNRSLVVLLPDPDGKVGQIEVTTDKGAHRVDQAYHSIQTVTRDDPPSAPAPMDLKEIMSVFGQTIAVQPDQGFTFWTGTLYCRNGSVELVESSHKALPGIIKDLKNSTPVEIYVIGHADRVGTERLNINLSHRRSVWVRDIFIANGIKAKIILISFYGESKPQVYTEDEIPEPLNRRVELVAKVPKR
jgi:outer membrane protein OmpA-like peptidoglycan-associated protein